MAVIVSLGIQSVSQGAKTIKKNTNSTQNKSQTHRAKQQYEVTSFPSTDCELSTETCSKYVYSLGPRHTIVTVIVSQGIQLRQQL